MGLLDDAIREHLDLKRKRGADPGEIERLEREALGPVRREPMARPGVPHLEVEPEHLEPAFEQHDEFAHPGLEPAEAQRQPAAHFDHEQHEPIEDEQPQKRGFLRRTRPASLAESGPVDFEQHLAAHDAPPPHVEQPAPARPEPPSLTFESAPPKRPRFSPEPSGSGEPSDAPEPAIHADMPAAATPPPAAPASPATPPPAAPAPSAPEHGDETHEWDVAHAFAAEDAAHHQAAPPPPEEDVLEETPEFLQDTPDHDRLWFEQRPPRDFDFDG